MRRSAARTSVFYRPYRSLHGSSNKMSNSTGSDRRSRQTYHVYDLYIVRYLLLPRGDMSLICLSGRRALEVCRMYNKNPCATHDDALRILCRTTFEETSFPQFEHTLPTFVYFSFAFQSKTFVVDGELTGDWK